MSWKSPQFLKHEGESELFECTLYMYMQYSAYIPNPCQNSEIKTSIVHMHVCSEKRSWEFRTFGGLAKQFNRKQLYLKWHRLQDSLCWETPLNLSKLIMQQVLF